MFWARAFSNNGWEVKSLFRGLKPKEAQQNHCKFYRDYETPSLFFFLYFFVALWLIIRLRPNVVICRGGRNRNLPFIAFWCRIFGVKDVIFFGSDADLKADNASLPANVRFNITLFRQGVRMTKYCVVQNDVQRNLLETQFHKRHILLIPNIWESLKNENGTHEKDVILWVGNTRKLKRPHWVFAIAAQFPNQKFIMIGGNSDKKIYEDCMQLSKETTNVRFLGGLPFNDTTHWFTKAKLLLCTSEYEGFPNTFLQAWSNDVPILSTVDPNNLIGSKGLGYVCKTPEDFIEKLTRILQSEDYLQKQAAVKSYFSYAHSLPNGYKELIKFLYSNESIVGY